MPTPDDEVRTIWQSQPTTAEPMSPEKLRARAKAFESKARRSVLINQISAGMLVPFAAIAMFAMDGGLLVKVAMAMLPVTAVYMVWAFNYFFAALAIPADAGAETCAAVHKRQLERQRDMNLSARSGGRLVLPMVLLIALSRHWPDAQTYVGPEEWGITVAVIATMYFSMELAFTYTDLLAHRFQQEINDLESMMKDRS